MASRTENTGPVVLVTGSRGFTGRFLCDELRTNGYRVVGAVATPDPGLDEVYVDLCVPETIEEAVASVRPDMVVHLAAISFVRHEPASDFYGVNVLGTLSLLDELARLKVAPRKVLVASSANVYGNAQTSPLTEELCPQPVNHYAASKVAMEHLVRTRFDRLPIVITRPFNYTGVGQGGDFLVPKLVDHFRRRAAMIELGNIDVERDFSDVRFVAGVYRRLLEVTDHSRIVNVASGRGISIRTLLAELGELSGHRMQVSVNPAFVRAEEVKTLVGDTRRLDQLIGEVARWPFSDTLRWMLEA